MESLLYSTGRGRIPEGGEADSTKSEKVRQDPKRFEKVQSGLMSAVR